MHSINYTYSSGKNQLASIATAGDIVSSAYQYDPVGNLKRDVAENVFTEWNLAGKVKQVRKYDIDIIFSYSPLGLRQSKQFSALSGNTKEWYIHDATGNIMCIYDSLSSNSIICKERPLYGSSRLGIDNKEIIIKSGNWGTLPDTNRFRGYCGYRNFELSNHLGNVLTTFSDRKWGMDDNSDGIVDYYNPVVTSYTDYYPFGYPMPDRNWSGTDYRFGFNGQEKDNEIYGEGKSYTAEFWQYDSRLGRRWNMDMVFTVSISRYGCFFNNPIAYIDPNGNYTRIGAWLRSLFNKDASKIYKSGKSWGFNVLTRGSDGKINGYVSRFGESYKNANSIIDVIYHSLTQIDHINITGNALDRIKKDPDMIRYQNEIVEEAKKIYAKNPTPINISKEPVLITFGGFTNSPLNLFDENTRNVASNELTWITRHSYVYANVEIQKDGTMNISYLLTDRLDLYPSSDRTFSYNAVCLITGAIYHGLLNGKASSITAKWNTTINIK